MALHVPPDRPMAPISLGMKSKVLTLACRPSGSGHCYLPNLTSILATLASSPILEHARLSPASGPLHLLSPLPGTLRNLYGSLSFFLQAFTSMLPSQ